MKVSTKRIYTKDGIELFGLLYEPDSKSNTVLVHVHGMGGNFYENKFLDAMAETLTSNGIAFFAFNNRGCEFIKDLYKVKDGKKEIVRIGNTFEKFEDCLFDISAAIDFVKNRGYSSMHLSGHSLGAPKVAYFAAEQGDNVASIIFISPSDMVGLALQEKNFKKERIVAEKMIADGKGNEMMPGVVWWNCYLSANTYMSLSDKKSKVAIFNFYDPKDELALIGTIKQPIIAIMGRKDDALTVPIEETMERVTKAAKNSSRVETKILGDANHGYFGSEQELADEILRWIKK